MKDVELPTFNPRKLAIVIQGPMVERNNFTVNSLRWYRHLWPGVTLILSTWEEHVRSRGFLDLPRDVVTIANQKPEESGPFNINMQLRSTRAGLAKATEIGAYTVLKVRSDQRIYNPHSLGLLESLRIVKDHSDVSRMVTISANSFTKRFFGLSDFLKYGTSEDQAQLWGLPEIERGINPFDSNGEPLPRV
mgnify:CR=1 FL=1